MFNCYKVMYCGTQIAIFKTEEEAEWFINNCPSLNANYASVEGAYIEGIGF